MNIEAGSFFWNELERAYDAWIDAWKELWFDVAYKLWLKHMDVAYKLWLKHMDEAHKTVLSWENTNEILDNLRERYNKQ
jgi:hypothetical protein